MLTWHTDYLENKNTALHFENVADPCATETEDTVAPDLKTTRPLRSQTDED